jgi:hypothetical protein
VSFKVRIDSIAELQLNVAVDSADVYAIFPETLEGN